MHASHLRLLPRKALPANNLLEEVKTFRGDLQSFADNRRDLHWAQAKIYR